MKKTLKQLLIVPLFAISGALAAGGGATFPHDDFAADMSQSDAVQRGAKYYMNYCLGCHSLKYQRYNRLAADTGLDEEVVKKNLIFTGASIGQTMDSAIPADKAAQWFGKVPPDLSLISRSKGKDYVYNYLRAFYQDDSKPSGVNNSVFPDVGMPHVLASLEGVKKAKYEEVCHEGEEGKQECTHHIVGFTEPVGGSMNATDYESMVRDLSQFLYYVSDPSELKRHAIGPWVLAFLVLFTIVMYALKKEYWRDVH